MNRHANAEEAEKEEFSAKFKQAKVTVVFFLENHLKIYYDNYDNYRRRMRP